MRAHLGQNRTFYRLTCYKMLQLPGMEENPSLFLASNNSMTDAVLDPPAESITLHGQAIKESWRISRAKLLRVTCPPLFRASQYD